MFKCYVQEIDGRNKLIVITAGLGLVCSSWRSEVRGAGDDGGLGNIVPAARCSREQ